MDVAEALKPLVDLENKVANAKILIERLRDVDKDDLILVEYTEPTYSYQGIALYGRFSKLSPDIELDKFKVNLTLSEARYIFLGKGDEYEISPDAEDSVEDVLDANIIVHTKDVIKKLADKYNITL